MSVTAGVEFAGAVAIFLPASDASVHSCGRLFHSSQLGRQGSDVLLHDLEIFLSRFVMSPASISGRGSISSSSASRTVSKAPVHRVIIL